MATKRKSDLVEEEILKAETEMAEEEALDPKDEEIAQLKAEIDRMKGGGIQDYETVQALTRKAAAEGTDPWTVKVTIRVPRRPEREDPWYWINVNSRSAQIPANDKPQEMKLPFAEALLNFLHAENKARDFADTIQVYDPVTNPHPQD